MARAKKNTDPKKKKKKRPTPSKPITPRRATSKGLKMPKNRELRRAQKGAMYQSDKNKNPKRNTKK